jgi:Fe2+ transport system protein FeoA
MSGGCASLCCPRCGYQMPDEPPLLARLRGWFRRPVARGTPGETTTLAAMEAGQRGTVERLEITDVGQARKLMALGVIPGAPVELERRRPAVVFRTGYTQLAVDDGLAGSVVVRLV